MRCPRCSALMETWPYDLAPFCTFCGFVFERRKSDKPKLDVANKLDRIQENPNERHPETQ